MLALGSPPPLLAATDRDLAEDLGEELAALHIGLALLALDLSPPRMT